MKRRGEETFGALELRALELFSNTTIEGKLCLYYRQLAHAYPHPKFTRFTSEVHTLWRVMLEIRLRSPPELSLPYVWGHQSRGSRNMPNGNWWGNNELTTVKLQGHSGAMTVGLRAHCRIVIA